MTARRTILALLILGGAVVGLYAAHPWDRDGDGAWTVLTDRPDCDDGDAGRHPGAAEIPLNRVDEDCSGRDSAAGSNVVLITLDSLRGRNLGSYGYFRDTSPNIDRLAGEGVRFTRAYAPSSWTLPSLASLLTSLYPRQHGVGLEVGAGIGGDLPLLTEILKRNGYATAMFKTAAFPLFDLGFGRGFDLQSRPADPQEARAWMRARSGGKFFLWIHFFRPHVPYHPLGRFDRLFIEESVKDHLHLSEPWTDQTCRDMFLDHTEDEERIRMAFYDEIIAQEDANVGEIIDEVEALGLEDRTLVIVSSDHGEEFWEHSGCDHGRTLYEEVVHVPLIIKHPGVLAPGVTRRLASLIDVAPTVLDLLGLEPDPRMEGASLLSRPDGERAAPLVYFDVYGANANLIAVRDERYKFIFEAGTRKEELYDLVEDPGEQRNLLEADDSLGNPYRQDLLAWFERTGKPLAKPRKVEFDAETRERLKYLGYIE